MRITIPMKADANGWFMGSNFGFCGGQFRAAFDLGNLKKAELVLSMAKPTGWDYYELVRSETARDQWDFAESERPIIDEIGRSPWPESFDHLLTKRFPARTTTLYAWVVA